MGVTYTWTVKVFDLTGTELAVMRQPVTPALSNPLNGLDQFTCTFYLDDPQLDPNYIDPITETPFPGDSTLIRELDRVIKVWREIYDDTDPANIIHYKDPDFTPAFAGHVTRVQKNGAQNQLQVMAMCPYWRLQSRFHLLNHLLVIDTPAALSGDQEGGNNDNDVWDISALCFRLIDLVNHAFGLDSATGIVKPITGPPFWPKTEKILGGYRAAKGNNVWIEITELLWNTPDVADTPDLLPEYIDQSTGNPPDLMFFKTTPYRGRDISAFVKFNFCTFGHDPSKINNLDDFVETTEITADQDGGSFANYLWAVGQAGPDVAARTAANPPVDGSPDLSLDPDHGWDVLGIYMYYYAVDSWADKPSNPFIQRLANAELKHRNAIPRVYEATPSPLTKPYYITNLDGIISGDATSFFMCGDLAEFNANKGSLQVDGLQQRIYEVNVSLSENCVESEALRVANDFTSEGPLT